MKKNNFDLETAVLNKMYENISKAIDTAFTSSYHSELIKYVNEVVKVHEDEIIDLFNEAMNDFLKSDDARKVIKDAFAHVMARKLVSGCDSIVSQTMNRVNRDERLKAKIILAVENIVAEESWEQKET